MRWSGPSRSRCSRFMSLLNKLQINTFEQATCQDRCRETSAYIRRTLEQTRQQNCVSGPIQRKFGICKTVNQNLITVSRLKYSRSLFTSSPGKELGEAARASSPPRHFTNPIRRLRPPLHPCEASYERGILATFNCWCSHLNYRGMIIYSRLGEVLLLGWRRKPARFRHCSEKCHIIRSTVSWDSIVLNLRTITSPKCVAVPKWARI